MEKIEYIWKQDIGGFWDTCSTHSFSMAEFNPIKITPKKPIPKDVGVSMSLDLFEYFPEDYTLPEAKSSSSCMVKSTDIEEIRQQWLEASIAHYNHFLFLSGDDGETGLITLTDDWTEKMKPFFEEAQQHKIDYPKYWI